MPKLPQTILPAFSEADIRALLAACDTDRDRAVVLALLDTGARLSEFIGLRVGDAETTNGIVVIRQGKGGKDRAAFLGTQARKALRRYLSARAELRANDPLWMTERGDTGLTTHGLQRLFQRLRERTGIEHCHAHTFRRTFAITCLRNGCDLVTLQRLMGHSDIKVLARYLAQDSEDLQKAHRAYGPVDGLLSKRRVR
jgi:site-specific recombinase XerD